MKKKIISLTLVIVFLFTFIATAQSLTKEEILEKLKKISQISDDKERLLSYDTFIKKLAIQDDLREDTGKWLSHSKIDPLTDKQIIIFKLVDENPNILSKKALFIRYQNEKTQLFISWNEYLGDNSLVKYRFDKEKIEQRNWLSSADGTATFYPGNPIEFINKIMTADKLVTRISPYNSGPITAEFDVRGLKAAAQPYEDTLNWVEKD
ncbi:hypothetical protein U472_11120 [Orenia metallireducens]|jgi:type VI secretion system protein VasI|uniref:Uncharacterized protein n=1 Tax=Orenia metallireducens TaxID=1413210 RepID=A0A1C0A8J1_9FIRM|nr:type VI secretion system-associated protein TagO [Orenia metallireducens]OCL26534.1 hypothetical protein U472_11120 [Orenia metallireducens]